MKSATKKLIAKVTRYAYRQTPISGADGYYDVSELIKLKAAMDTADYCMEHMPNARAFASCFDLLSYALTLVTVDGLYLEFGVASGNSINHIARHIDGMVHGFDCFEGLPEDWHTGFAKGAFAQKIPDVNTNVKLHVGLFDKTLPAFVQENPDSVAFLHVDCDLYSSTKEIFRNLAPRIGPKTVIVFDEYFNHPTWRHDEWLAFKEFVADAGLSYKYIGYVPSHQQVCVVIE